ncbi:glycosyltransferase involved in cell wall biosynthesis [Pedobacter sp. UYP24]
MYNSTAAAHMQKKYFFKDTTLLITHYNRSNSLERLLRNFESLNCEFEEIIVSDDCSKPEHLNQLEVLEKLFNFRLLKSDVNRGLANNINKGEDAIKTSLTLYIQEDFIPLALFPEKLELALTYMHDRPDLDMVRFYAYFNYPYLKSYKGGFSDMIFKRFTGEYKKFYYYSDHPHLRRKSFISKFGRYIEGIKSDRAEYRMMFSFIKNKGKALFYNDFKDLFDQRNDSLEPSTVKRNFLRESDSLLMTGIRNIYRLLRFNYDLFR